MDDDYSFAYFSVSRPRFLSSLRRLDLSANKALAKCLLALAVFLNGCASADDTALSPAATRPYRQSAKANPDDTSRDRLFVTPAASPSAAAMQSSLLIGHWTITGVCGGESGTYGFDITSVRDGALTLSGGYWNCGFEKGRIDGDRISMSCSNWLNKVEYEGTVIGDARMEGAFTQKLRGGVCQWVAVKGDGVSAAVSELRAPAFAGKPSRTAKMKKSARPQASEASYLGTASGLQAPVVAVASSGLYRLDDHLGFDTLDGASFNPENNILTLFGHRASQGNSANRRYLSLLAEAIEADHPILSLEWTAESQVEVDKAMAYFDDDRNNEAITSRLAKTFDESGRVIPQAVAFYKALGVDLREGMNKYEFNAALLAAAGRPGAGDALRALGVWVDAARRDDIPARNAAIEDLARVLGNYDYIAGVAAQKRAGEISENEMMGRVWPRLLTDLAHAFGWSETRYVDKYWRSLQAGMSYDDATAESMYLIQVDLNTLPRQALDAVMANTSEVVLPTEVMHQVLGSVPRVRPVVTGMSPHSRLAMVAYEADYFSKTLFDMPGLAAKVPRYRGYFAWLRDRGERPASEHGHLWISPGDFALRESTDQRTLYFDRAPMKFHIESYVGGRSVADPQLTAYADLLTSAYEDIARHYPVLEDLRESAKVVALSNWLRQRGYNVFLPRAGRESVNLPREVPGVLYMVMAVKSGPSGEILTAAGGIDYVGDGAQRYDRGDTATQFTQLGDEVGRAVRKRLEQTLGRRIDVPPAEPIASVERENRGQGRLTIAAGPAMQDFRGEVQFTGDEAAALRLWKAGDLDAAEVAYRKLIEAGSPDTRYLASLHALLAQVLHEKGDDAAAKAELHKAVQLDRNLLVLSIMLAKAQADSGDLAAAATIMREVVARDPDNAAALQVRDDLEKRLAQAAGGAAAAGGALGGSGEMGQLTAFPQAILGSALLSGSMEQTKVGSELHDIRVAPVRLTSHPPTWAHYEGRDPEVLELQQRRDDLVSEMQKKESDALDKQHKADVERDEKARASLLDEVERLKKEAGKAQEQAGALNEAIRQHLVVDTQVEDQAPHGAERKNAP